MRRRKPPRDGCRLIRFRRRVGCQDAQLAALQLNTTSVVPQMANFNYSLNENRRY
jgi:hypothetical protein